MKLCDESAAGKYGAISQAIFNELTDQPDVTGHAASAFRKSLENGIACPPAG